MANKNIKLNMIFNETMSENSYFLHTENSNEGILFDPGIEQDKIEDYLQKNIFIVKFILLTHGHFDHIYSAKYFSKKFNAPIYVSIKEKKIVSDKTKNMSKYINGDVEIQDCNFFNPNETLSLLDFKIECLSTPGHTIGSTCFYIKEHNLLISGDTLFNKTYGNTSFYSGDYNDMKKSLKEILFYLPDDTQVYPGHGISTTIRQEKIENMINN